MSFRLRAPLKRNKKGIIDGLTVGIVLFALSLVIIIGLYVLDVFRDQFVAHFPNDTTAVEIMNSSTERYNSTMDGLFLTMVVAMAIVFIVTIFLIPSHPIFFVINLILLLVFGIVFATFSDSFATVFTGNVMTSSSQEFSIIPFVMDNFVVIMVVLVMGAMIFLFIKQGGGGFGI